MMKRLVSNVFFVLFLVLAELAGAAFDPVNDDTDIFLANPNIAAERPNVLIVLDNTANWNQPFTNEKSALVQVVNNLSDQFNVGLMMFPETGGGNDSIDGGYVRYHVRQMTSANKTALASIVNNLHILNDKGNNATPGLALYEAYLYYAGLASRASYGKVKTDVDNTTDPLLAPLSGNHALPASPTSSSLYRTPIVDGCQRNFIIYISNGPANENASARSTLQGYLETLTGKSPPDTITINPNGQQANWADEMTRYLANADINASSSGTQNAYTYVVEVNPSTTGQGSDMTALLRSMATNGKGKYFGVTSDASGSGIVDALNAIFTEVQAVNSVFASTTLPVSVNVRGTNLNQVYIGVFRPDPNKAPRWLGNLKMYNLARNSTTGSIYLADATNGPPPSTGIPAENSSTGFVTGNASSFWTANSTFWSFRDASQNGVGGSSDKPDGDLVEKGGAAQQLRLDTSVAPPTARAAANRTVYTCTGNCLTDGVGASLTLFNTSNSDIDASSLDLDTRLVSPLTALATQSVTTLTDRRSASLSNAAAGAVSVSAMSAGNTTRQISTLVTDTPKTINSLTALGNQTVAISNITKVSSNWVVTTAAALPSAFVAGATVTFSGFSGTNSTNWNNVSLAILASGLGTTSFRVNPSGNPGNVTSGSASTPGASTTARAYLPSHGYTGGQTVTIAGASPSQFNKTTSITADSSDPTNYFTYLITPAASAATIAGGYTAITASGSTTTATATTTGGSFVAGTTVNIRGASGSANSGYNGAKTVVTTGTNTFTYSVGGTALANNTNTGVVAWQGASTTVTATTATAHGLTPGISNVTIAGSDVTEYNGTWLVQTTPTTTSFTFNVTSAPPDNTSTTVTASTGTQATVTVTAANHGFAINDQVIIESSLGSGDVHAGTFTILTTTANTFTYTNGAGAATSPTGTYTVRPLLAATKAIVTVTAHGYTTGDQVYIANATPTGYNGGPFTITVQDANTFTYPVTGLITALGANTASGVTVSKRTTTARATSVAHGFTNGSSVAISGATPTDFNGTYTVAVLDANTFTYTIGTAQGDATGTIRAAQSGTGSSERTNLINWIRGEDNFEDENAATPTTDIRASIHGDVLHSRPAVVNYNRYGSDNDVYIYYGANDGVFHAVKGGYASDGSDPSGLKPGSEAWGFIANEFFPNFKRLRNNSPIVSSSFKKSYFMDGSIGVYTKDANSNGKLGDTGDTVNLYISMRRGGRMIYALDVNDPTTPKFLWKITNSTTGFSELGQTWSQPTVVTGLAGLSVPVIIFGAGYDPEVEDIAPSTITGASTTSVTVGSSVYTRSMGRGIYVVNALTGELIWSAGRTGSGATKIVNDMDYAIPSDITIIKNESGGNTNRAYVGDTGGNVWRIDFARNTGSATANNLENTTVTKLAAVGGSGYAKRKFLFAPDVVGQTGYDAVLMGSGDREHPFDTTVTNRMYMFKDFGNDNGPVTGATVGDPTIIESAMFDATSNCIQDSSACSGMTSAQAASTLSTNRTGWYVTLATGEKVVGTAISIAGTTFFNTNQPSASAGGGTCGSNLGVAKQYQVGTTDATATNDLNASGGLTGSDRSFVHPGGGYLPSPVHVVVQLDGRPVEAVISGIQVTTPTGATLNSRLRRYWYKEVE